VERKDARRVKPWLSEWQELAGAGGQLCTFALPLPFAIASEARRPGSASERRCGRCGLRAAGCGACHSHSLSTGTERLSIYNRQSTKQKAARFAPAPCACALRLLMTYPQISSACFLLLQVPAAGRVFRHLCSVYIYIYAGIAKLLTAGALVLCAAI
jgi:hypothetical protein